jgi:hypothetical protein
MVKGKVYLVLCFLAVPIWVELTLVAKRSEQSDSLR